MLNLTRCIEEIWNALIGAKLKVVDVAGWSLSGLCRIASMSLLLSPRQHLAIPICALRHTRPVTSRTPFYFTTNYLPLTATEQNHYMFICGLHHISLAQ